MKRTALFLFAVTAAIVSLKKESRPSAAAVPPAATQTAAPTHFPGTPPRIFAERQRVLFQGDSITDMNRGRTADPNHILGHSYAFLIAARFGASYPETQATFINRGISGNRVADLAARWQTDTLDLKPDVLSVLVGVNDIYFTVGQDKPFSIDQFESDYDQLLTKAAAANPALKMVLCEPFIEPGKNTTPKWDQWHTAVQQTQSAVARLAERHKAPVVHLQKVFDDAAKLKVPADYWVWDGIHPTYAGQQLLADEWVRTFESFYGDSPR